MKCPSAEWKWSGYANRRDYFGVVGGKTRHSHGWRGDVFLDGLFNINLFVSIGQITDGTSHTLAIGESIHQAKFGLGPGYGVANQGGPVNWWIGEGCLVPNCPVVHRSLGRSFRSTKYPINANILPLTDDEENEVPYGSGHPDGALFVFADGHVQFLRDTVSMRTYQALSTYRDGEESELP